MKAFLTKMAGGASSPPGVGLAETIWSTVGAFLGIGAVALIDYRVLSDTDMSMMLGSFGASAVLVYGAPRSPLAQPRNLVGGHIISAIMGVTAAQMLPAWPWIGASLAVATSIAAMHVTRTLHPPGGATALIAVVGSAKIHALGFFYVIMPVAAGSIILLAVALLVNNLPRQRKYPEFWY